MDIGSVQPTVITTPIKSSVSASDIATASGANVTRIEPSTQQQTENNTNNQNESGAQQRQPAPQQPAAYSQDKGYIFQPGIAGIIYQVKDADGKVVDQTPSKQRLTQIAYEQKIALEEQLHAADRKA